MSLLGAAETCAGWGAGSGAVGSFVGLRDATARVRLGGRGMVREFVDAFETG
jgi:hypothetical protein